MFILQQRCSYSLMTTVMNPCNFDTNSFHAVCSRWPLHVSLFYDRTHHQHQHCCLSAVSLMAACQSKAQNNHVYNTVLAQKQHYEMLVKLNCVITVFPLAMPRASNFGRFISISAATLVVIIL